MSLGPIMMDLEGTGITPVERELMENPLIGGIILFTRNFESIEQISALIAQVHALRSPHLLVAIDHEGGRVQRFHDGFTRLPPARVFDDLSFTPFSRRWFAWGFGNWPPRTRGGTTRIFGNSTGLRPPDF